MESEEGAEKKRTETMQADGREKKPMPDSCSRAAEGSGSRVPPLTILTMPRCTVGTAGPPEEPLLCTEEAMCGAGKAASEAANRTGSVRVGVGADERLQRQGAGGRQAAVGGLDRSTRRTLEQERDWEQKRRRDLRRRHTFYSPRKRARAPPPSSQLESRTRWNSSQ